MKKTLTSILLATVLVFGGAAFVEAVTPEKITAEEAFDARVTQTDPFSGEETRVALIDVRSRAEYFWVGAANQVDSIVTMRGKTYEPDLGKARLRFGGRFLTFEVDGRHKILPIRKTAEIKMSPISKNIPWRLWDERKGKIPPATRRDAARFKGELNKLRRMGVKVVIFFCRSGKRSDTGDGCAAIIPDDWFEGVYEIDDPEGKNARGGFEGSDYGKVYNGYRGFPGRLTEIQDVPSVSWKDAGLPIEIGRDPFENLGLPMYDKRR